MVQEKFLAEHVLSARNVGFQMLIPVLVSVLASGLRP